MSGVLEELYRYIGKCHHRGKAVNIQPTGLHPVLLRQRLQEDLPVLSETVGVHHKHNSNMVDSAISTCVAISGLWSTPSAGFLVGDQCFCHKQSSYIQTRMEPPSLRRGGGGG